METQLITTQNKTRICIINNVEDTSEEFKTALELACKILGSNQVIAIRYDVKNIDGEVLDHSKYYYFAQYE